MRRSVSILHWASVPGDHSNGSIFFIDTGTGIFGVTAKHVYEAYKQTAAERAVLCKIGGLPFDPSSRVVSEGTQCDVVTFSMAEDELQRMGCVTIPWPPIVPQVGQPVLLGGFPGAEKSFSHANSIDLRMYAAMWRVDSVSSQDISIVRPPDSKVMDVHVTGFPQRQYDFGGMSGGPVAVVLDQGNTVSWALSGVIYEAHQSFEILKAVRADFIRSDGTVAF